MPLEQSATLLSLPTSEETDENDVAIELGGTLAELKKSVFGKVVGERKLLLGSGGATVDDEVIEEVLRVITTDCL